MNHRELQRNQLNDWRMTVVLSGKSRMRSGSKPSSLLLLKNAMQRLRLAQRGEETGTFVCMSSKLWNSRRAGTVQTTRNFELCL
ncbi:hypothetical protein ACKS0A_02359 [Histoplasma ohiense]